MFAGWVVSPAPNPQPGGPGYALCVCVITFDLSGSSNASASAALRIIWPHKIQNYVTAGMPAGEGGERNCSVVYLNI
jgi:hypothetical protein